MRNNTTGNSDRQSDINNVKSSTLQDITGKTKGNFTFGRVGMDYFVTNRTTLSASGVLVNGKFRPTEDIDITTTTSNISSLSNRLSNSEREFKAKGLQLGMKHNFPKAGEEWDDGFQLFWR